MTDAPPSPAGHPTDRLLGTCPVMAALRAQIRHLASFDTVGNPYAPTVLLQGETGAGKGLVARVMHDSGPQAGGLFVDVNCSAIPESMLEAELFGFEPGAFTDAKRAKPGLIEAASRGTLFLDEIDALPLALPPLGERGADILLLAQAYLGQYSAAHGVPPKRLNAEAATWLQDYVWPGNVRELSHVMERVTLLHVGEEVDAATLRQLCTPPAAEPPVGVAARPQEPAYDGALPAEAEQIRQALVQTGGNVARAARLLGVSRDSVRYRMQRYGVTRPRPESTPAPVPLEAPKVGLPAPPAPTLPHTRLEREQPSTGPYGQQNIGREAGKKPHVPTAAPVWEQKAVVVLALELTWPVASAFESSSYDLWTEMARWEQSIVDKVRGFGGVLLQRTPALLTWVFGVPQTLEQLPQRAVHSALAIRHMVTEASAAGPGAMPRGTPGHAPGGRTGRQSGSRPNGAAAAAG